MVIGVFGGDCFGISWFGKSLDWVWSFVELNFLQREHRSVVCFLFLQDFGQRPEHVVRQMIQQHPRHHFQLGEVLGRGPAHFECWSAGVGFSEKILTIIAVFLVSKEYISNKK